MSIAESQPVTSPAERLFTAADLAHFPSDLPSGPIDFELDNGRLVFIPFPPGNVHGAVQIKIGAHLFAQGEQAGHGKVRTETGVVLWRGPDSVVAPDVAFIASRSLPLRESSEGYLETIPDLAVEIRSKNDKRDAFDAKIADYLKAGVQIVWAVDPQARTVTVHSHDGDPVVHTESDTLTLPDMIPGFSMPVADALRE